MTTLNPSALQAQQLVRPQIAELEPYVPGEQPQGGKWIKLNTNENPYPPSPAVARAIVATATGRTLAKYPDPLATVFRMRAAEILGVNRLGVATRLARGRKELSAKLDANRSHTAKPGARHPPYLRLVK